MSSHESLYSCACIYHAYATWATGVPSHQVQIHVYNTMVQKQWVTVSLVLLSYRQDCHIKTEKAPDSVTKYTCHVCSNCNGIESSWSKHYSLCWQKLIKYRNWKQDYPHTFSVLKRTLMVVAMVMTSSTVSNGTYMYMRTKLPWKARSLTPSLPPQIIHGLFYILVRKWWLVFLIQLISWTG